jgi:predicted unusual protein kinase regulating ubiquinone biosynthesis (AarF/ABC1/UbiB family)
MAISLKPEHLKRYKDIALLLLKHGRSDLVKESGLEGMLAEQDWQRDAVTPSDATELADDLERMGPIFIKLGQLLSTRPDILPLPYIQALTRLQDDVEPFSYEEVEAIIETELGFRISKGFHEFDPTPIASASLGQVHRATLRSGRPVAVKVQRPGIRKQIAEDVGALMEIAEFLDRHSETGRRYQLLDILDEFQKNLLRELDYRQEARNMVELGRNLQDFPLIVVPSPVHDYTTSRVLTMDYVHGRKVTALGPLAHLELDADALAEELFRAYLKQILVDGIFHADPHPGNVFLTDDNRIALIDLGMVGRISPEMQEQLLKLLLAMSEGRGDEAATIGIGIGQMRKDFDEREFRRRVAEVVKQQLDLTIENIQIGRLMLEVSRIAAENGIRTPSEFTMLGKTLLNLDQSARALAPGFNPNESIRRNAADITRQRVLKSISPGNVFSGMIEMKEFAQNLPGRVNRILDAMARNEFEVKVEAIDEDTLVDGFQKVANRITVGLIVAALIVGAALLMRIPTAFTIFGYPGLAILCFLGAAGIGFWLVVGILLHDRHVDRGR